MDYKKMTIKEMAEVMKAEMPHVWERESDIVTNPLKQFLTAFSTMEKNNR